ncbi:hypothetical protein Misp06_01810 [Microbulbifer sp. NBRC 101763]|uniref:hypothetical protein n=1 Tax=unclassified Microbulbifer TaxID=2619833 RepID=UPI00309F9893
MRKYILYIWLLISSSSICAEVFNVKTEPGNGSRIKQVAISWNIPFDKPYGKLSEDQKKRFTSIYENLNEGDEPPFPVNGLQELYMPIYAGHKKLLKKGKLHIIALIDEEGKVESISVFDTPSELMTKLAIVVLRETEFKPAKCSGSPCKMDFPLFMNLKVR